MATDPPPAPHSEERPTGAAAPESRAEADSPHWKDYFRRARDPLFLLNRRRQIVFVNDAWQEATGLSAAEVRGQICKRPRAAKAVGPEGVLSALCPPPEVLEGQPGRTRRLLPGAPAGARWWDVVFFPFTAADGELRILGKLTPVPAAEGAGPQPLPEKLVALRLRVAQRHSLDQLHSVLPALHRLLDQVRLAARVGVPLLLTGEPGTGKHWLARAIHYQGARAELAFAALDCARLRPALLTAILFGDAGLLRRPGLGTLYLREPSCLPRDLQERLCQVLALEVVASPSPGPAAGPRIMAGCSLDPQEELRTGRLHEDLYYSLSTFTLALPPLRERVADLPWLAERFLARAGEESEHRVTSVSAEAWAYLGTHAWPGNLGEFYTVLADACLRARGDRIEVGDLPAYLRTAAPIPERTLPLKDLLKQVERRLIQLALRKVGDNKTRAADLLAIWRPLLIRRMKELGITTAEDKS
jgi:transcriptional regulator with PAS, ATPase and Fis domain